MQKISFCERYMLTTAVLKRFKTNTRRLEKELERLIANYEKQYGEPFRLVEQKWDGTKNRLVLYAHTGIADTDREHVLTLNTRYKVGEVVAVAQSYENVHDYYFDKEDDDRLNEILNYYLTPGWSNKMFVRADLMSHQIQITDINIERLQDISKEDCLKEGIKKKQDWHHRKPTNPFFFGTPKHSWENSFPTAQKAFAALINRPGVGRKGLWESNPWVVCYSFQLVK